MPMLKSYTIKINDELTSKKQNFTQNQPKSSTLNTILNFSKSIEILKGKKENFELGLN
jgi:hypothetical protein